MWIKILCLASASFFVIQSLPLIAAPPVSINSTTTVTVEGYGTDVQSAIDNATQNALLNVAGAYISSDTTLETRTKITDGIRTYSKSFKDRTSQTSNGVIQDVMIQNVTKLGNQFKAVAQVTVRTGELRTYVLELSEGENTVPEGLFSSVKENVKNQERGMLTFEQIFLPILDGTAIQFDISKPKSVINTDKSIFLYNTRSSLEKITDPRVVHIRKIESIKSDYF